MCCLSTASPACARERPIIVYRNGECGTWGSLGIRLQGSLAVRAVRVGDRLAWQGRVGTAIEVKGNKILLSFYSDGSQIWFDMTEVERAGIAPRKK